MALDEMRPQPSQSVDGDSTTPSTLNPEASEFRPFEPTTNSFPTLMSSNGHRSRQRRAYRHSSNNSIVSVPPPMAISVQPPLPYVWGIPLQYPAPPLPSPWNPQSNFEFSNPVQQTMPPPQHLPSTSSGQTQTAKPEKPTLYPPVNRWRAMTGWPRGHPPIYNPNYNGLHPANIPDIVFLEEQQHNPLLAVQDPFASGTFDASRTPWWTHWTVAVAHTVTNMEEPDICKFYKWRYANIIPGIQNMTPTDETELWIYLDERHEDRYAFEWEEKDENQLRGWVWDFLSLAYSDEGKVKKRTFYKR